MLLASPLLGLGLLVLPDVARSAPASTTNPGQDVIAVSLFKNGFASVTREFVVRGTTLTLDAPVASLGTLFFTSDDGSAVTVEAIPGTGGRRRVPLQTMGDLLRANVGKRVFARLAASGTGEESKILEGEIISVGADLVVLKMSDGQHVLPISRVIELASAKSELRLEVEIPGPPAPRSYRIVKSKPGGRVRMTSLEPGLAWAPSYRIDLSDPKTATVVASSTIFDDDYDLKGVRARLVTGFPAARYRNVAEPLATKNALPEFLAAVAAPETQPPLRRDLASTPASNPYGGIGYVTYDPVDNSVIVSDSYGRADGVYGVGGMGGAGFGGGGGYANRSNYEGIDQGGGTGESLGELFFYQIPSLTIAKGTRRLENLFRFDAPYRHINTFEIGPEYDENLNPIRRNQSDGYQASLQRYTNRQATEEDLRLLRESVWHEIEIENRATQPLTSAVGAIIEREELIGQGNVDYTPAGAKATIRLDRALDLVLDRKEEMTLREPRAVKSNWDNSYAYDRITMKGTITVRNPRQEPVILKGRKRTIGEMTLASPNGKITTTSPLVRGINGTSVADWEITIAPGATATLEYTYLLLTGR